MSSTIPVRLRLTAAIAASMLLLLGAVGLAIYARGQDELDERETNTPAETTVESETLDWLEDTYVLIAPLALLLATLTGYVIAGRALVPVDESMRRQREFTADASHELRTPLAILKTELELAGEPGRSRDELREAIGSAEEEVDRLTRLADDLLIAARAESGTLPIQRAPADVGELAERVAGRFTGRAQAAGRTILVDAGPGPGANVDVARIEQVLANLIENSLRHGAGAIGVHARRHGEKLVIEISDEGHGFPAGFETRAFERFTRADPARSGGGVGLGLAIVREIARAHGGDAEIVPSEPGTIVRVTLAL